MVLAVTASTAILPATIALAWIFTAVTELASNLSVVTAEACILPAVIALAAIWLAAMVPDTTRLPSMTFPVTFCQAVPLYCSTVPTFVTG